MLNEQGLALLGDLYLAAFAGSFAFLVTWEGGASRSRLLHVGRNVAIFALVVLLADGVVGAWLLHVHLRLAEVPAGVFSALRESIVAQLVIGLLALDLFNYAFHRLCHRVPWLWLFHCVHHSDQHVDASTGIRFHPVEISLSVAGTVGVLTVLGLPLWIEGARAVIMNPLSLAQHANVSYPRWIMLGLRWLIVTQDMHLVHHSLDKQKYNTNFGQMFSFWDRLFGTYHAPHGKAGPYGLRAMTGDSWQSVAGMLLTPWRSRGIRSF
jgi:sterol desaturase/sphingolipid hydroxylase (fatty acid hydroxylase superfamily)